MNSVDTDLSLYLEERRNKEISILGLSETNVDWRDYTVYTRIQSILRRTYYRGKLIGSSSGIHRKRLETGRELLLCK